LKPRNTIAPSLLILRRPLVSADSHNSRNNYAAASIETASDFLASPELEPDGFCACSLGRLAKS